MDKTSIKNTLVVWRKEKAFFKMTSSANVNINLLKSHIHQSIMEKMSCLSD